MVSITIHDRRYNHRNIWNIYGIHNIYNLDTEDQIKEVLEIIDLELRELGIYIVIEDARVLNLEINITFIAEEPLVCIEKYMDYLFNILYCNNSNKKRALMKKYKSKNKYYFFH